MLGTIVNAVSIIVGAFLGLIIKGRFNKRLQDITNQATSLAVIIVGLSTAFKRMLFEPCNSVLFVASLVIGGIIGTLIDIEGKMKKIGDFIESKCKGGEGAISKSFVAASILYCTGSMAIMGSIESGINHDYAILFTKSIMDGFYSVIFASTLGIGVAFSAVSVFLYQGTITILAGFAQPYLTGDIMREISLVGGILIAGIGIDMLGIRKINVGNLLPAVVVPVIYYGIIYLINWFNYK